MKTTRRSFASNLRTATFTLLVLLFPFAGLAQPHYVEIGSLPVPTASERAEVFDAATSTWFSFPYYNHGDLTSVYYARHSDTGMVWTQTASFPARTTYWGRAASDGTHLYFSGTIDNESDYTSINGDGSLSAWQSMTPLPTPMGGRGRSLHQTFVFQGRLYVTGGWYGDGLPAYADAYYAPIQTGGTLGSFIQTTSLPEGMTGHSTTVSPDGKVYLVYNTNGYVPSASFFVGQIATDGSIASWDRQPNLEGVMVNNAGNTAITLVSNLLVVVGDTNTFICRLNSSGHLDSVVSTISNPAYLYQRSVYAIGGKPYVTATTGKMYRIDGLPEPPASFTNRVLTVWVAFNDQTRGPGTAAYATAFSAFTNAWGGEGNTGPLRDAVTGNPLPVTLTITNAGALKGGYSGMPYPGTPADAIFKNYVDFATLGDAEAIRLPSNAVVGYVFTGLAPARTYAFHGTAVRGTNYADRWSLCQLAGAASFAPAHTAGVLTSSQFTNLGPDEAVFHSGNNTNGDVVGWSNIRCGTNGTVTVVCRPYAGPVDGGTAAGVWGYGLTALRLEETTRRNSALSLDGDGDYVTVPNAADLQNPTEITVEAWIYPQRSAIGRNNTFFIAKSDGANGDSARSYELRWAADGGETGTGSRAEFIVFLANNGWIAVGAPAAENTWVHVAACFSSSQGVLQLFTNGLLASAVSTDGGGTPLAGALLRQTTLPVRLGRVDYPPNDYARGFTDEVRIWNKARTPEEIYRDRFCNLTGTESHLVAYWTFDDGTATDQTGHGHDGTFAGDAHAEPIHGNDPVHAGVCGDILPNFFLYDGTAGGGIVMPDPFQSSFSMNSFVTLTAMPANGWTFLDWTGVAQGTNPVVTLQMGCDKLVTARFGTPVTVSPSGNGTISMAPSSALYPYGSTIQIAAQPGSSSYFTGWSGGATGTNNPLDLTVRSSHPVIFASFTPLAAGRHALTVIPDGRGRVTTTPRANSYTSGQSVTLHATPDGGQDFLGWIGDADGTNNPLVLTLNQSKAITARFTKRPILDIERTACDGPLVTLTGEFSGVYRIQSSMDLSVWFDWQVVTNAYGLSQVIVPVDGDKAARFYQAIAMDTNAPTNMALIPGGGFTMGDARGDGQTDETPLHTVFVNTYYMDKYEVTKDLWDEVYAWAITNGYSFDNVGNGKGTNHPVQLVNWCDVVKWCNARSEKTGRIPAYYTDANLSLVYRTGQIAPYVNWDGGYRLPTEAEWEKAGRGGLAGKRFPWGDTISHSNANYNAVGSEYYDLSHLAGYHPDFNDGVLPYTSPVGHFPPNGYGLYDMAGNVWEWCWDWYADTYYAASPEMNPLGAALGTSRVYRGGGYGYGAWDCRTADRHDFGLLSRSTNLGFRCVLPLDHR